MHDITDLPAWERLFKKIVWKQLGYMEGKKILDFGSGEGITANHFAEKNDVTAIEPSKEMLSNAWKDYEYTQFGKNFIIQILTVCNSRRLEVRQD